MAHFDYKTNDGLLSIRPYVIKGSRKITHVTMFNSVSSFNINATQLDETIEILTQIKERYKLNTVGKVVVQTMRLDPKPQASHSKGSVCIAKKRY